jgi:hypothetical protein
MGKRFWALATVAAVGAFAAALGTAPAGAGPTNHREASEIKDPRELARYMFPSLHQYWMQAWAAYGGNEIQPFRSPRSYYFYNVPGVTGWISVPKTCDPYGKADGRMWYGPSRAYTPNSFYCQPNESLYLDYLFLRTIMQRDDGRGILIIAHEFGHHIQALQGWPVVQRIRMRRFAHFELHADCYAGAWFSFASNPGSNIVLERNDLAHAERILGVYGPPDGTPWYEPSSHSSHSNRQEWFLNGFDWVEEGRSPFTCNSVFPGQ